MARNILFGSEPFRALFGLILYIIPKYIIGIERQANFSPFVIVIDEADWSIRHKIELMALLLPHPLRTHATTHDFGTLYIIFHLADDIT